MERTSRKKTNREGVNVTMNKKWRKKQMEKVQKTIEMQKMRNSRKTLEIKGPREK